MSLVPALMALALAQAGGALAPGERVIGLLALPEVFGEGPCKPFEPRPVMLYADADGAKAIGTIEVDQNWSFAPHGGCEGLEVSVRQGTSRAELPTREYDYEAPAAIALEQRGLMVRIVLANGTAWVQPASMARLMPYEDLLEEFAGVTSFTQRFDGALRAAPGATLASKMIGSGKPGQPARVLETRRIGDQLWLHVEVLSHSTCVAAANGPPETVAQGWVPAHAASGEPTVWFSSRGC